MAGAPEPKAESRMSTADAGGDSVDPTKNVLDLVRAESKYQDFARESVKERSNDLRAAETRRIDQIMQAETRRVDAMLEAETRRQDELRLAAERSNDALRAQRMTFEFRLEAQATDFQKQIAAVLAAQTSKDALLLSQAVDKLGATTSERLSTVEKNQYIAGGSSSVREPGVNKTLEELTAAVTKLTLASGKTESKTEGKSEGLSQIGAIVLGVCTILATIIAATAFLVSRT